MKRQIRHNVFETNSSTCHTLVIPKRDMVESEWPISDYQLKAFDSVYTFGRGLLEMLDNVGDKISYVFMLICYDEYNKAYHSAKDKEAAAETASAEAEKWKNMIIGWISERASSQDAVEVAEDLLDWLRDMVIYGKSEIEGFGKNAWIEHPEEMLHFVDAFRKDNSLLKKFLFDVDAYATVCGDEYRGAYLKRVGFEADYSEMEWSEADNSEATWESKLEETKKDFIIF